MKRTALRRRDAALAGLALSLLLSLPACTVVPAGVVEPGQAGNITQLGGRMNLTTRTASLQIDNVESFKDGSKLIDNGIKAWGIVTSLNRYFDSEDATTAATAATRKTEIDASTEAARIASEERLAAQAMELEAAEAVVPAVPVPVPVP
jgi:hypothetical protein